MNSFETLVKLLGDAIGCSFTPDEHGVYEVSVQGRILLIYCQEPEGLVLSFGVVMQLEAPLQNDILRHALALSLFGQGTQGFSLGLFGNALLLSNVATLEALTIEVFVEQLYLLSRQIESVRQALTTARVSSADEPYCLSDAMPPLTRSLRI